MEYLNSYGKLYSQGKLEMDIAEKQISAIEHIYIYVCNKVIRLKVIYIYIYIILKSQC